MSSIKVNCEKIEISNDNKICIIAGPCQLENEQHAMDMAGKIQEITNKLNLGFIYKTSFDKANRTSLKGKRGAGLDASLPVFDKIKKELNVPILTDVHSIEQCSIVSDHADVLQIPAFLCNILYFTCHIHCMLFSLKLTRSSYDTYSIIIGDFYFVTIYLNTTHL